MIKFIILNREANYLRTLAQTGSYISGLKDFLYLIFSSHNSGGFFRLTNPDFLIFNYLLMFFRAFVLLFCLGSCPDLDISGGIHVLLTSYSFT